MAIDLTNGYADLLRHVGHELECTTYGEEQENVVIECMDCNEILISFDADQTGDDSERFGLGRDGFKKDLPEDHTEDIF